MNKPSITLNAVSIVNATISANIPLAEKATILTGVIKSRLCFPDCSRERHELERIAKLVTPIRDGLKDLEKTLNDNKNA